jgi:hypothetical protein
VNLGNLAQIYTGTAESVTATTTPTGLLVNLTYNGIPIAPTNAGTYTVVATVNNPNYFGSASNTFVIGPATAGVNLGGLSAVYNGSPQNVAVTTAPGGLATTTTYNGSSTPPVNAGNYAVVTTVCNANYTGSTIGTLVVAQASASVALANLNQIYTGTPRTVTATTVPAGLGVSVTYNGNSGPPTNTGSYLVIGTVTNANYFGIATNTLIVANANATVTLSGLSATFTGNAQPVTATTSPPGLATTTSYNGLLAAPTNAGSYAVLSTINDPNYTGSAAGTLVINPAAASVNLGNLAQIYTGTAESVTATTTPTGLLVNLTYNGIPIAPTNSGSYAVAATVNNPNYFGSASNTLVINPATAVVSLGGLSAFYNGNPQNVTVSTLPAGLAATATYNGATAAPVNAGSYLVAVMVNDSNYVGGASNTLVVTPANATVSLSGLSVTYTGNAQPVVVTTSPAGLANTTTYSGLATAPVNAGNYALVTMITDANYGGAATNTLTINPAPARVNLANLSQSYTGTARTVTASTTPTGLGVALTYNGSPNAPTSPGTYIVVGTIISNNFTGSATNTLTVTSGGGKSALAMGNKTAAVMLFALDQIHDGTAKKVGVVTVPAGLTVVVTYTPQPTNGPGGDSPSEAGSYTAIAEVSDSTYTGSATNTLTIYKPTRTLVLSWPKAIGNPAISTSTNLVDWLPLGTSIGPTNKLVVPKQGAFQFFQGPSLQVFDPAP